MCYAANRVAEAREASTGPRSIERGENISHIGVDHYVHLCLKPTHPMEFRAREDGRIVESIFLQVHPEVLEWDGVKFTPDVSNKAGVTVHSIEAAKQMIDFEVLFTRTDWRNPLIQLRSPAQH